MTENEKLENPSLEELLSASDPVKIFRRGTGDKEWSNSINLLPYENVKSELLEWAGNNNLKVVNQSLLKSSDPSLYNKLTNWSYALNKTRTAKAAIYHMGLKTLNGRQNSDIYTKNVLKLFPEEKIYEFFESAASKQEITNYIKNAPKILRSTYQARKYRKLKDNLNIGDILDNQYPEVKEKTGLLPSQILYFTPFSDKSISEFLNSLYYSGKDIRFKELKKDPFGRKVIYFIRHPDNRPKNKFQRKRTSALGNYQKELSKYFELQNLTDKYILNDDGSRGDIASLSETEFSFFLSILSRYDPYLENFPELKNKIDTPLEKIIDPSLKINTRISHDRRRYSDGRFNAGGKSYLVELKKTDYISPKNFFSSLSKYRSSSHWFDGEKIDKRILFIDEINNGNGTKISSDWIVLRGDEFESLYRKGLDLLFSRDPNFTNYSPMSSADSLKDIHNLIHNKSHFLARKGYKKIRRSINSSQIKNMRHLISQDVSPGKKGSYDFHYEIDAGSLGIYPNGVFENIPEGYLFIDLETNGLRNTGSHLVSATLGERKGNGFDLDVYFARTPFESREIVKKTIERINSSNLVFTYNGRNFDIPFINEMALVNMINYKFDKPHTDLYLDYYRKTCKQKEYPSSSLKVFERTELSINRRGDILGRDIPKVYSRYLLGEEDSLIKGIKDILFHNLLDVASMPYLYRHSQGSRFSNKQKDVSFEDFKDFF